MSLSSSHHEHGGGIINSTPVDFTPLYMSLIAGMSTCLGAAWVLFQRPGVAIPPSTMCFSLALAGSVMVTVSVVSILPEILKDEGEEEVFRLIPLTSLKFFYRLMFHLLGYILYFLLAKFAFPEPDEILGLQSKQDADTTKEDMEEQEESPLINSPDSNSPTRDNVRNRKSPSDNNPPSPPVIQEDTHTSPVQDVSSPSTTKDKPYTDTNGNSKWTNFSRGNDLTTPENKRAWRVAMLLFVSLSVHNFPEGLAVAASAMNSHKMGLKVTIGIMVHNIPEGVSIAVPCIAARPNQPWLAFWLSALSGLAEPFGAFCAIFVLSNMDTNDATNKSLLWNMENVLSFVAGIMIAVAFKELFPEARRHNKDGNMPFITGTLCGMVLMLATELYMEA